MTTTRHPARGYTIAELIVVIVVIGILATLTIVSYNGVQQRARDKSVLSDLDSLDGIETRYGLRNNVIGKAYYSGSGVDAALNFTPSPGNVIDVVIDASDYCIRGYNPQATKNSLSNATTKESSTGACNRLPPSNAAQAVSPLPIITDSLATMEASAGGWTKSHTDTTLVISTTDSHGGTGSLKMTHPDTWSTGCSCGDSGDGIRQTITDLIVGKTYTFNAWVKTPDASNTTKANWAPMSPLQTRSLEIPLQSNVWTEVKMTLTAQATTQYIFLMLYNTNYLNPLTRTIYIDDISVTHT